MPALSHARHVREEFWCVFAVDPGQSVESKGSVCLHIKQRAERERDEPKEICVKERQPQGSKCFDKFSECR